MGNTVAGTPALQPALQRHGSRGEEGEEVDLRANWEAAREAKGFGEQEEQAVHWEAEGPTEEQHKGLRFETPLRNFVFTQRLEKNMSNTEIQLDCSTDNHWF